MSRTSSLARLVQSTSGVSATSSTRLINHLLADLMKDVAKRSVFVIDETGAVVYDSVSEDPKIQVDFEAIRNALGSPVQG